MTPSHLICDHLLPNARVPSPSEHVLGDLFQIRYDDIASNYPADPLPGEAAGSWQDGPPLVEGSESTGSRSARDFHRRRRGRCGRRSRCNLSESHCGRLRSSCSRRWSIQRTPFQTVVAGMTGRAADADFSGQIEALLGARPNVLAGALEGFASGRSGLCLLLFKACMQNHGC